VNRLDDKSDQKTESPVEGADRAPKFSEKFSAALKKLEKEGGPRVTLEQEFGIYFAGVMHNFESKGDAKSAISALEKSKKKLKEFLCEFKLIKKRNICRMEWRSEAIIPEPEEDEEPDLVPRREEHRSFENLFRAIQDDLDHELKRTKEEKEELWGSGRGAGLKLRARDTAVAIAKLYVEIREGDRLTRGKKPNTNIPSTLFCQVSKEVFDLLDIDAHFYDSCKYAVEFIEGRNR